MLLHAIGELLPVAVVIALNPVLVIAVVVLLSGPRAAAAGPAFTIGWAVGLAALTAAVVLLTSSVDSGETPVWLAVLRVLVGVGLLGLAVKKVAGRPRGDEPRDPPGWMDGLATAAPARAGGIGLVFAAVNPKHLALVMAAAPVINQDGLSTGEAVAAGAVFVLLGTSTVLACLLVRFAGGRPGKAALERVHAFMVRNVAVLVAALLAVIGAKILGDGIAGLG